MQINFGNIQQIFKKRCSNTLNYTIGETGPTSGIIAYDKGQAGGILKWRKTTWSMKSGDVIKVK